MSGRSQIWRGRLALAATIIIWSTPPIFQFWLARDFDPWSQNFYRYAAGFLAVLPFLLWRSRWSLRRLGSRDWLGCAAAAVPNVIHQVAQTIAVVLLWPGIYALLGRMSVIFTALLAVVFFADERWIGRSLKFQAGTVLALAGVIGLVWVPNDSMAGSFPWTGFWLAVTAALGWSFYGIMVKKFTVRTGPALGFGMIGFSTAALLLPLMLLFGDASTIFRVDAWTNGILFGSGIVSIGLGHWLYYVGIRDLGVAPSQSALLLCPLGTILLSTLFFDETFGWGQIAAGAVLLAGAFLALAARSPLPRQSK